MSFKLFVDTISQPARSVLIFCKRNKLPFEQHLIALRKLENKTEEYTAVNPFQCVPAISDDGMNLTESVAILQYLATKYKVADHWFPSDLKRRARVQEFLSWQFQGLRMHVSPTFLYSFLIPIQTGKKLDEKKATKMWGGVRTAFGEMESVFLKSQPFVAGDEISIADLLGACEIMQLINMEVNFSKEYPILTEWLKRVRDETNPDFDEVHKIIYKLVKVKEPNF